MIYRDLITSWCRAPLVPLDRQQWPEVSETCEIQKNDVLMRGLFMEGACDVGSV